MYRFQVTILPMYTTMSCIFIFESATVVSNVFLLNLQRLHIILLSLWSIPPASSPLNAERIPCDCGGDEWYPYPVLCVLARWKDLLPYRLSIIYKINEASRGSARTTPVSWFADKHISRISMTKAPFPPPRNAPPRKLFGGRGNQCGGGSFAKLIPFVASLPLFLLTTNWRYDRINNRDPNKCSQMHMLIKVKSRSCHSQPSPSIESTKWLIEI